MRIGISVYGMTFSLGIDLDSRRPTITPSRLIDKAFAIGLEGVELPASLMQGEDATAVAHHANKRGLFITLETEGHDPGKLASAIDLGGHLGAGTVRTAGVAAKLGGVPLLRSRRWQS